MQTLSNTGQSIDFSAGAVIRLYNNFKIEDTATSAIIDDLINVFDIDLTDLDIEGGAL